MAQHAVVILEDGTLRYLASRADLVAEFPFLRQLLEREPRPRRGGRCCTGKAPNNERGDMVSQVKRTLIAMSRAKRERLKAMLSASTVRITYRDPKNKIKTVDI